MNYHIEKEYKILIDKNKFNEIVEKEDFDLIIQENHYYDLNTKNAALRIRNIDDLYILTIKIKEDNLTKEYEYKVSDNKIDDNINALLLKLNLNPNPKYLGSLLTSRYYKKLNKGELVIDLNRYLDFIDYEIEFELYNHLDDDITEFNNFLTKYKLNYTKNSKSKFKRFLERKNNG